MIRALIFDFDGVIVDTEPAHAASWSRLCAEQDWPFGLRERAAVRGRTHGDALDLLSSLPLEADCRALLLRRKQTLFSMHIEQHGALDVLPGVRNLLDEARDRALPVGLASSSRNARPILAKIGLIDRFEIIADGNFPGPAKPAPDIFTWVAHHLGCQPKDCAVIEDSDAGTAGARAGGFAVIALPPASDASLASLEGVTIDRLNGLCP